MGNVNVDKFFVGGQEEGKKSRGKERTELAVFAIEKRDKGICRMHSGMIPQSSIFDNLIRHMLNAKRYYLYE